MNTLNKLMLSAFSLIAFGTAASAQNPVGATATATATATIVTPIAIVKNADLVYGNIAVTSVGGTVVLATDGSRTRTGGVTLPAAAGQFNAAAFTVTGTGSYTYAITLPTTVTLTRASGTETMAATAFTSSVGATGTLASGTQDFTVGATLAVAATQAAGVYTSAAFDVTVNYN